MNKALHRGGVPHSSGFRPEEQTATASLLRLTGTVQNTNVEEEAERRKDRRGRVMKGVEKEEEEGKTLKEVLMAECDEKSLKTRKTKKSKR